MADDDGLTLRDQGLITFRAALQAVPHVGPSLDQFLFGPMQERRERRVMRTLQEVGERLSQLELDSGVANERFAALLEHLAPDLARATTEERRERFRDLLFNAARLDPNSESDWENAAFAGDLLRDIEAPGLSILAGVASASSDQVTLARVPVPQVHDGTDFAWDAPPEAEFPLPYDWTVIEEWARRLQGMRLLRWGAHRGGDGWERVDLTELGWFLVSWILTDDATAGTA